MAVVLALASVARAGWFGEADQGRVKTLLSHVTDLQSAYYAAIGLKALHADIPSVRAFHACVRAGWGAPHETRGTDSHENNYLTD